MYGSQSGRSDCENDQFTMKCVEWDLQNPDEMVLGLGDLNEHVGRQIDDFEGVHNEYGFSKRNMEQKKLFLVLQ